MLLYQTQQRLSGHNKDKNGQKSSTVEFILTLTLLLLLFTGTLFILAAAVFDLLEQDEKLVQVRFRRDFRLNERSIHKKTRKSRRKRKNGIIGITNEVENLRRELEEVEDYDYIDSERTLNFRITLLLLVIIGGFTRIFAYGTEIILFFQGNSALVGGLDERELNITIP